MLSLSLAAAGLLTLVVPCLQLPTARYTYTTEPYGPLRFKSDGSFQLAIFEDLHFGENAWDTWGPQQDINTVKVLTKVLECESLLDLVVLNGDLITGENTYKENSTAYLDQIVAPMLAHHLTWASTYGNHDSDYNISHQGILEREQHWPNARTQQMVHGPNAGVSNYYLPVYGSDCRTIDAAGCTPRLLLWFFDSRGGFLYQEKDASGGRVGQADWVDESVVAWYTATSAALHQQHGRIIPSLAFVHIPVYASLALQEKGVDLHRQPGINDDVPLAPQAGGWCSDGSNTPGCIYGGQDVPFMHALSTSPGLMALFSGHDHGDTWCYKWDTQLPGMAFGGNGLNLCFGQHSGYGGYGNWIRGARQVKITERKLKDLAVDTYIRLESGAAVGAVTLNSTYGRDVYPQTPNDMTYCPTCNYSTITPMPGTSASESSPWLRVNDPYGTGMPCAGCFSIPMGDWIRQFLLFLQKRLMAARIRY